MKDIKKLELLIKWLTDGGYGTSWKPLTESGKCVLLAIEKDAALWREALVHRCDQEGCDIPKNLR
jgi:hypothetical protein